MAFWDDLKRQAMQAAKSVSNDKTQNLQSAAKDMATNMGNKKYQVILNQIPSNLEEMQRMSEADLLKPENTAALTVAALCMYPADKESACEMLNFLQGPKGLSGYDRQFLTDRFREKDYVPRSYFEGALPQNNYEPKLPYTLNFFENPYSRSNYNEGYLTLFINSGGADSPRQIKLRKKPSTGQWFLWEQFLLADIRMPVSEDPWA